MMEIAYERASLALVARVSGVVADQDLRRFGEAIIELDRDAAGRSELPVTILIVVMDEDRPTAEQRRMMADLWTPTKAPVHLFALVSTSPIARGIMKVVQWLNPPGARRRESAHGSFTDAALWAERERGKPIPGLGPLHDRIAGKSASQTAARR
jgi:hypothetical protein